MSRTYFAPSLESPEALSLRCLDPHQVAAWKVGRRSRKPLFALDQPPWVLGSAVSGWRQGTILYVPTVEELTRVTGADPGLPVLLAEPLQQDVQGLSAPHLIFLPRLVPEVFFPPGDGADTFGVTRRLHLESRPRIVYLGRYDRGIVVTELLQLLTRLFTMSGEAVLWEGLAARDGLAPVVKRLRLSEMVIFAPPLSEAEAAGLLLGADLILVGDTDASLKLPVTWAMASGNPIVARHTPENEALLGSAALWIYQDDVEVWVDAVTTALQSQPVRDELAHRQWQVTQGWRLTSAAVQWQQALTAIERGPTNLARSGSSSPVT